MGRLACPNCEGTNLKVTTTNTRPECVWRLRICTECRLRMETIEAIDVVYTPTKSGVYSDRYTLEEFQNINNKNR